MGKGGSGINGSNGSDILHELWKLGQAAVAAGDEDAVLVIAAAHVALCRARAQRACPLFEVTNLD
jgi:hypothetical protein